MIEVYGYELNPQSSYSPTIQIFWKKIINSKVILKGFIGQEVLVKETYKHNWVKHTHGK